MTQVLNDGTNNHIYGNGRIAQINTGTAYFLGDALGSVRQLTNSNGAVTYASTYDPYGVTTQTYGASQTAYGYTGEYTDSYIKLNYLRSRWYDPASGRFQTKDSWQGDYNRPLSLNRWMYVEGNPTNYVDPTGMWRWALSLSEFHNLIEDYYEGMGGFNAMKQLEYSIPGTGRKNTWGRVDMFNSSLGEVYEIEPWYDAFTSSPKHGAQQALAYVFELNSKRNLLVGNYGGWPYNWSGTQFHLGLAMDWPGKYRQAYPLSPNFDLVADYVQPEVIAFWLEPNGQVVPIPLPIKKYVKPENWNPRSALQPAYVLSGQEVCGQILIYVGGAIIAFTIAEDIATLGIGTFDDVITVPGGLLFINIGQRIAVPVMTR